MIAVYMITNTTNGLTYIGSTGNFHKRMQKWRDWRNCASNPKLIHDFETIGFDKFQFDVIQVLPDGTSRKDRERIEYDWIRKCQPFYNTIGKERPPDVRAKLSAANMGKKHTAEQLQKQSASLRARFAEHPRDGSCTFKPVFVVETGETYESVKAAESALGVAPGAMSRSHKRGRNVVKGYHFQYLPKCRD